ncbi:MAG: tetratricopeptide repeat protein [Candidatus Omnitrophota bacterium]|nr:tetratricopeptide repeat protein [Candidatus Omnitrophota bacterium]
MNKCLWLIILAAVTSICFADTNKELDRNVYSNELPMYGGIERTSEQKEIDDRATKKVIEYAGNKETALKQTITLAWQYYYNGDIKTAIKRFNQAWLLDPNNTEVFYGFGIIMAEKGNNEEAINMFKKALEFNPKYAMAMCNLGRAYKDKALTLARNFGLAKEEETINYFKQAANLYENAAQLAILDDDLSYIYYQWAVILAMNKNFKEAWDKINLSRKHGGKSIEEGFVRHLSMEMPEPIR